MFRCMALLSTGHAIPFNQWIYFLISFLGARLTFSLASAFAILRPTSTLFSSERTHLQIYSFGTCSVHAYLSPTGWATKRVTELEEKHLVEWASRACFAL